MCPDNTDYNRDNYWHVVSNVISDNHTNNNDSNDVSHIDSYHYSNIFWHDFSDDKSHNIRDFNEHNYPYDLTHIHRNDYASSR